MNEKTTIKSGESRLTSIDLLCPAATYTHLDGFAGIGGFSLAARWLGWETIGFIERDNYCQKVLRKNFGDDILLVNDINDVTANTFPRFDIATFGLPCQPFSCAGKQKGTDDERYLWDATFAIIQDYKPRWVVLENVAGFVKMALSGVQSDLERIGYETQAFVIPACAVNAPHRRNRLWLVANADGAQEHAADQRHCRHREQQGRSVDIRREALRPTNGQTDSNESCGCRALSPYTDGEQRPQTRLQVRNIQSSQSRRDFERSGWSFAGWREVKPTIRRGDNGFSNRMDRLRVLGNGIVPEVAYEIFSAIQNADFQRAGT